MTPQPLLVLAPPFGDASRVAAMFGAHPQAVLLPELHLTMADTIGRLLDLCTIAQAGLEDGLLRAVAVLFCGGDVDANSIERAREWLLRRADRGTEDLLWEFAERTAPRQLVVPDTSVGWRPDTLRLLDAMFPDANWLHVVSHPRVYCGLAVAQLRKRLFIAPDFRDARIDPPLIDPQLAWLRVHANIDRAAAARPGRLRRLRVEQLYAEPETTLEACCDWLGWDRSATSVAAMMHPERTPFATPGPLGAQYGLETEFIESPWFARRLKPQVSLDGPLDWRRDGLGFGDELRDLAGTYGYR